MFVSMKINKTKNKVKYIFSTLGIGIDHKVYESIIGSYDDIRLISRCFRSSVHHYVKYYLCFEKRL